MKILITGGHITPALAVIDELRQSRRYQHIEISFVGRRYVSDREKTPSYEFISVAKRNVRFYHLWAGRLTRRISLSSYFSLILIPVGFFHALYLLLLIRPKRILSFGGYLALPIAVWAWIIGIPIYAHEQTMRPGITNQIIGKLARRIFIAFPQAKSYFPQAKTMLTGNPIRASVFITEKDLIRSEKRPVIYITGGSLGAHAINGLVKIILPDLLQRYSVIHQTGAVQEFNDYQTLCRLRGHLPESLRRFYLVKEQITDEEIGSVFHQADLVVGRSGANTAYELLMLKKPALLIPLPWSAHDEQLCHARYFQKNGIGEIFTQNNSAHQLLDLINKMIDRLDEYRNRYQQLSLSLPEHAAQTILDALSL